MYICATAEICRTCLESGPRLELGAHLLRKSVPHVDFFSIVVAEAWRFSRHRESLRSESDTSSRLRNQRVIHQN